VRPLLVAETPSGTQDEGWDGLYAVALRILRFTGLFGGILAFAELCSLG
jgi:hypothetical protein